MRTHPFNGPFSRTTRVSQTDNHASTPPLNTQQPTHDHRKMVVLLCPPHRRGALSDAAIRPSVPAVRTVDPSRHGRTSATIGGGHIISPRSNLFCLQKIAATTMLSSNPIGVCKVISQCCVHGSSVNHADNDGD